MYIAIEKNFGNEVGELLTQHLREFASDSPPESMHALGLADLQKQDLTFWCAWKKHDDSAKPDAPVYSGLMGFAALKELDHQHVELKSMRTHQDHLRSGVAAALLSEILLVAETRGYTQVSLETGSMKSFAPAHALYKSFEFKLCPPFSDYVEDPNSVYMTRPI